jgi:hypothetical protein
VRLTVSLSLVALAAISAAKVTSPEKQFGHIIGADYELPNYADLTAYWKKLDKESDRMKLVSIGKTEEGRDQLMAIVSSPGNLRKAEYYRGIAKRLALAKGVTEEDARKLAKDGKSIVWIDGGLHANEVLGAQQLMETLYQVLSRDDRETKNILDSCIILFVHANPDGMDLVSNWYTREKDPKKRSTADLPRLYQKYIGHDNNRDFYMGSQKETENMLRIQYHEWFPQIIYNHHQTGPAGAVIYCPPFRAPFNHNVDALATAGTDLVGQAIHNRFIAEGKGGSVRQGGASYSSWWNGGLRTTAYFHNMIGILTEAIGNPTPQRVPFVASRQISNGDLLLPVTPGEWHFRQSIDYSVSANYALLDLAAQKREEFLYGIYRMGRNSIEKGSKDTWTPRPKWAEKGNDAMEAMTKDPAMRDARAYVIPSHQKDFPTAVKFVNTLLKNGVVVDRATAAFSANGKSYPAGSLVVRCDQAFRPHILDMFEPQDHPNDIPVPGANPIPPYDSAGWTLAYQMGVSFDRVLEKFDAPTEEVTEVMKAPSATFSPGHFPGHFIWSLQNDSFTVVQRLLTAGQRVDRTTSGFFVRQTDTADAILEKAAKELGVESHPTDQWSDREVKPVRVGLWDRYGGSMESGWTRFILDKFEIPYKIVYANELDAGNLKDKFDVLIFPDGAGFGAGGRDRTPDNIPDERKATLGSISAARTVPKLKEFMEAGGTVIAVGTATNLAVALKLPVESALVDADGKALPRAKYYIPGSVLQAQVDSSLPVAAGMPEHADFMFDNSPVFRFKPEAEAAGLKKVVWFDTDAPLRSGWAWGQSVLKDGIAAFTAPVGAGMFYAFGPEITFRAQSHGTFRLLFNAIYK